MPLKASKLLILWLSAGLLAGCGRAASDTQAQIEAAVQATLAALPTPTAYIPLSLPTPPPPDLVGLFCEYQFCIGHPAEISFFDLSAQKNPVSTSTYSQGIVLGYNAGTRIFIQVMWQEAPGISDPQFMLDLIVDPGADVRSGSPETALIGALNVLYVPITSNASALLPAGGAAAWTCGARAFAWKAYAADPDTVRAMLVDSLRKFRCNNQ
jgi:hypothetical protein